MSKPIELYNACHPSNILSQRKEEPPKNTSTQQNGEYYTLGRKEFTAANSM